MTRPQTRRIAQSTLCSSFYNIRVALNTCPKSQHIYCTEHCTAFLTGDALTQQRCAELCVNAPVFSKGPEHQPIGPMQLGKANIGFHDFHLPVRVEEISTARPDHHEHGNPHTLLHHLQQSWRAKGERQLSNRPLQLYPSAEARRDNREGYPGQGGNQAGGRGHKEDLRRTHRAR